MQLFYYLYLYVLDILDFFFYSEKILLGTTVQTNNPPNFGEFSFY